MKIWIYLERLKPTPRWGIRASNKWFIVKEIEIHGVLETRFRNQAPHAILFGIGKVDIKNDAALIYAYGKEALEEEKRLEDRNKIPKGYRRLVVGEITKARDKLMGSGFRWMKFGKKYSGVRVLKGERIIRKKGSAP